ncbi:MAG: GxxExxY protein [Phycisphaerae bacterium]|jgi:GxxExxY protein|nr:GxxExxY protein [Phycisphaerae bacterium]
MDQKELIHKELVYQIVGCAMKVHRELGYGFLEKVYENSLMLLLNKENIPARQQCPVPVRFEDKIVGEYFADILIEDKILIEIKTVEKVINVHYAQLLNYLKATGIRLGLLINFGPRKLEYERIIK